MAKQNQERLTSQMAPGKEIMTRLGLLGTLLSLDELLNVPQVKTSQERLSGSTPHHRQDCNQRRDCNGVTRRVEGALAIANAEQEA